MLLLQAFLYTTFQDSNLLESYQSGLSLILADRQILFLGIVQSVVESCMYIFVFLWTPVLAEGRNYLVVRSPKAK